MVEKFAAGGVEVGGGGGTADTLFKFVSEALDDVDEVFLHPVDVFVFVEVAGECGDLVIEIGDIVQQVRASGVLGGVADEGCSELAKEPGITDGTAADHQSCGTGAAEKTVTSGDVYDVAVGDDGAGHVFDGEFDTAGMHGCLVTFPNGPAVDGEGIDVVFSEDFKEFVELVRGIVADAGFDGEGARNGGAQGADHCVHVLLFPKEAAAGVLAADNGGGAAEVEVDACNGVSLEFPRYSNEGIDVATDKLSKNGALGCVLGDATQDFLFDRVVGVDAKVFSDVVVWSTVSLHDAHERQVGDVLHGCQSKLWSVER